MADITLENYKNDKLYPKIIKTVGILLQEKDEISTVDVLIKMGNLAPKDYDAWRRGKISYLKRVFQGSLSKAGRALRIINFHMHDLDMIKTDKIYRELNGKRILRFSKSGIKKIEEVYAREFKWNRSQEIKRKIIEESTSSEG
ncbi:MAG: hypothetical protein JXA91_07705 [Candidatus Thermoplasmatota archaeon]|nr:hypothetical protein [Candidatus Thermoplasmatota archaeon]